MAEDVKRMPGGAGLPEMPEEIILAPEKVAIDWLRLFFIVLGLAVFFLFYFMGDLPDAVDPSGTRFPLPPEGRMALGLSYGRGVVDLRGHAHRRHRHRHRPLSGGLHDPHP